MNETLDIKDFALSGNVDSTDRILLSKAQSNYFAGAISIDDFKNNFLKSVFSTNNALFTLVNSTSTGVFNINNKTQQYAKIVLEGANSIFTININNYVNGSFGKILVFQNGNKRIVLGNMVGSIDIPTRSGTIALIEYNCVDSIIYCHSTTLIPDISYNAPSTINDLSTVYYDSTTIQLMWSTPHGDQLSDKIDGYDIRYSSSQIDANVNANWIGMTKLSISDSILPLNPYEVQHLTLDNLKTNQEYYIYIKSFQLINGVKYYSNASNFAYGKTLSNAASEGKVYRISLKPDQIHTRLNSDKNIVGQVRKIDNLIDETNLNQFLDTGYVDTDNVAYSTEWGVYMYGRNTAYLQIIVDLQAQYTLDKLFLLPSSNSKFSIFTKKDFGYQSERLSVVSFVGNQWSTINLNNINARFVILCCDQQQFSTMSVNPSIANDAYGIPDPYYNYDLGSFLNMLIYGVSINNIPDKIKPVSQNIVTPLTVDQMICTNGHFYQSGRIHSMCSGQNVRLYGHLGQFGAFDNTENLIQPDTLEDIKFRLNNIPWVKQNGPGLGLQELLQTTYKPYGLKPFITGTGVLDYCSLTWNSKTYENSAPVDNYYFDSLWSPLPKNSIQGLDEYLNVTADASNYKIYSKLAFAIAGKYGKNIIPNSDNFIWSSPDYPTAEPMDTGLDLLSGFEYSNEVDRDWEGFAHYRLPQEKGAALIAVYDANGGYIDSNNNSIYGAKNADSDFMIIVPGNASVSSGYEFNMYLDIRDTRTSNNIPFDALNQHIYCSNIWLDSYDSSYMTDEYAVTVEKATAVTETAGTEVRKIIDFRNRYLPNKPFWLTEFGYGEGGARNSKSRLQCYSIAGKQITDTYSTTDKHRSDIKGAWTLRGFLYFMNLGVDMINHYITMADSEWFGSNGPGLEMFRWDEFSDNTIGAKYNAIQQYEASGDRGGFNCFGLFGHPLLNGAYPISRSYWYIAQFRYLLKDYVFLGTKKYDQDDKVLIYVFRKKDEDKGAYVVYYNDDTNNGLENVTLDIPESATTATLHTQYIPKLPDPSKISNRLGTDQFRTGLPTTRKEKYINGEWVIQNRKPDGVTFESFSNEPAIYPTNPQEGDVVNIIPTSTENPYFPIVGPVCAKISGYTGTLLGANQYDVQENVDGELMWVSRYNTSALTWRQVDAVCDYIQYTDEGQHGVSGDSTNLQIQQNTVTLNIDEIPKYILFDGIPDITYDSTVSDLSAKTINSTTIQLWWNNNNPKDTGYQVFISVLPETGYALHSTITAGINTAVINGLLPNTTYYIKLRPVYNQHSGTLSDYISTTTYTFIPDITSVQLVSKTSSTITLSWVYDYTDVQDFYQYSIYRDSGDGNFVIVGNVTDINTKQYTDINLTPGKIYNYKLRAYGLNGKSEFTQELTVTTLTVQESSPDIIDIRTDKLGTKIRIKFNLDLTQVAPTLKNNFTLTESGNQRLITNASVDITNPSYLILTVSTDSLSEYTNKYPLKLSYNAPELDYMTTVYGVKVDSFTNKTVINVIGNFINLESTYYINFTNSSTLVTSTEWNNVEFTDVITNQNEFNLIDTYGRDLGLSLKFSGNLPGLSSAGVCSFTNIPDNAKVMGYDVGIPTNPLILTLNGTVSTNSYKVLLYASAYKNPGNVPTLYSFAQAKVPQYINGTLTDIYTITTSNSIASEVNAYMSFDELYGINNKLDIQLMNPNHATYAWNAGSLNFAIIEEYKGDDTPENTDVYLRSANIAEDDLNIGQVDTQTVHINTLYIGTPTHIRVSEDQDFSDSTWVTFSDQFEFTLSSGFGNKTIYVQIKNSTNESNIKIINVEYIDSYVPLQINNIFINNNSIETYNATVSILIEKLGSPTSYKIAETIDDINNSETQWISYPSSGDIISYTFNTSNISETKKVYIKLKDALTETNAIYDEIEYVLLEYDTHTIVIETDTVQSSEITSQVADIKYNKKFVLSLTSDDNGVSTWNRLFNYCKQGYIDNNVTANNYWHKHMPNPGNGGYPSRQLTYTTGTGVRRIFPITSANWYNLHNNYWNGPITQALVDAGASWPYLTWYEQEEINDFGGACTLHDVQDPASSTSGGTIAQIINGINDAEDNVIVPKLGYKLQVMTEPNGDAAYTSASEQLNYIKMITRQRAQYLGYDYVNLLNPSLNIDKLKVARNFEDAAPFATRQQEILNNFITPISQTVCMYGDLGMHGLSDSGGYNWNDIEQSAKIKQLNWLYETYGAAGSDTIWFSTPDEVLHYMHYRAKTNITVSKNNQTVTITVNIPRLTYMYNKELTINTIGISGNITNVTNNTFYGFSYNNANGIFVINCDMNVKVQNNAEKYVALFEESRTAERLRDANYMIQLLADRLKAPYQARVNALISPNTITSFTINSNESTVTSRNININSIVYTGEAPTKYRIAETEAALATETWIDFYTDFDYTLTNVVGSHTVYLQLQNVYGNSNVFSKTITYQLPPEVQLESISINNGDSTTSDPNVTVTITLVSGSGAPEEYMISENALFTDSTWMTYVSPNISYTFEDGNTAGIKTIFLKLQNVSGESNTASDQIEYTIYQQTVVLGNVASYGNVDGVGNVNVVARAYTASKNLYDTQGTLFGQEVGQYYNNFSTDINVFRTKYTITNEADGTTAYWDAPTDLTGTTGQYPNSIIYNGVTKNISIFAGYTNNTATMYLCKYYKNVTPGTYSVKILCTTGSIASDKFQPYYLYVQDTGIQVTDSSSQLNNNTNYTEFSSVVVDSDGLLCIRQKPTTVPFAANWFSIPPITVIEIKKLS